MADRYDVASLEARELVPGHHGRFVHSEHTTHVYWTIEEGALLSNVWLSRTLHNAISFLAKKQYWIPR